MKALSGVSSDGDQTLAVGGVHIRNILTNIRQRVCIKHLTAFGGASAFHVKRMAM